MVDERDEKPVQQEEEYQYGGESETSGYQPVDPEVEDVPAKTPQQLILHFLAEHRRLTIFMVVFVAVSIVYQFVGGKPGQEKQPVRMKTPVVQQTPKSNPAPLKMAQQSNVLSSQVSGVKDSIKSNQQQINQLRAQLAQAQQSLALVSARNFQMARQLQVLFGDYQKRQQANQPKVKVMPTVFYIQAIVPGRAWLSSNKGGYVTVSLGSKLPEYGSVRRIDAEAGLVMTSSGKMIHFSANN